MSKHLIAIALVVIAGAVLLRGGYAAPAIGLDAFLSNQLRLDFRASNDSFVALPSHLKRSLLSPSTPPPSPSSLLSSLHVSVPIFVKLVGTFSSSAATTLNSLVSAAVSSSPFYSIAAHSSPHHGLAASHLLQLHPSAAPNLAPRISAALRPLLESSTIPFQRSSLVSIPHSTVDDIIREDFRRESSSSAPSFYIYLLNLDRADRSYGYSYTPGDSSPAYSKCLGSIWAGGDRYLWIDLAAGPVDYGPALSGEGVLPRGEFHPLTSLHGGPKSEKAFLADLASLVLSAYKALLVPSLRIPVFFDNSLLIHFVHIRGEQPDKVGLDFDSIEKTIKESDLLFKEQTLKLRSFDTKYDECSICSFAIARSMTSYTSRFLFENYTLSVSEYLDSKRLHQILSDSADEVRRAAGIDDEEYGKVIPVYVFDLDYDRQLLLDRFHQAVAFRDMVIAVRTRNSQTVSDYKCNGRHMITQSRNLNRAIVGSLLQSMWGISPTHLSWSPVHNGTLIDYTWSVGQTPFGPFSDLSSLSFAQKDAAKRNTVLTVLNYTITSVIDILDSMAAHGSERELLKKNLHMEFTQRWNFFKHKMDKVTGALSHLDFDKAMYYLRSSDHDLYAIHTIVYQASQELEASLVCFKDPPFPWMTVSMVVVLFTCIFYVYLRRHKIFRSKRKQF